MPRSTSPARRLQLSNPDELEALRSRLGADARAVPRWNPRPEQVQRSVLQLVLTLAEFIRELLERQALHRMEAGTLSAAEIESIGVGLLELERTIHELAAQFALSPQDLNLDLGPLGRLR